MQSDADRDAVVVVSHGSSTQMAREYLDLEFVGYLPLQNLRKVFQLMGTTADELVNLDELRNFFLFSGKAFQKWISFYFVCVFT